MATILGFLLGPIGRWIIISLLSVGFLAWIRADAAGPWKAQAEKLSALIVKQHQDAQKDRALAEANAARAQELENEISRIVGEGGWTKLRADELERLRRIAGGNSR